MGLLSFLNGDRRERAVRTEPTVRKDGQQASDAGATLGSFAFPNPQLWGMFGGWSGSTGLPVTPLSAMQAAAVYGCVKALSDDIGKLPVRIKRKLRTGGWVVDTEHPINRLLAHPNVWQTPIEFWSYLVTGYALRGNSFAAVRRGQAGQAVALIPINPDRCAVMISPRGWLYYNVSHPQVGDGVMVHQDDMVHTRNLSLDGGYLGLSPIALAQDVVGVVIAAQQHAATLFRQGAQLGGVLTNPGKLSREAAERMAQSWADKYSGVQNAHKVAVLEENTKFEKIAMTSEDAQLLDSRKFGVVEICRLFRVPPHKVFDLSDAHYSNMEQATQEYIDDGIEPICARMRQRLEQAVFFEEEQSVYSLEFDYSVLKRGDRKTRFDCHAISLAAGFRSVNEVRAEEGWNGIGADGDVYRHPLNTGTDAGLAGAAAPGPASADAPDAGTPAESEPPRDTAPAQNVVGE